jgi:hypothetical protein
VICYAVGSFMAVFVSLVMVFLDRVSFGSGGRAWRSFRSVAVRLDFAEFESCDADRTPDLRHERALNGRTRGQRHERMFVVTRTVVCSMKRTTDSAESFGSCFDGLRRGTGHVVTPSRIGRLADVVAAGVPAMTPCWWPLGRRWRAYSGHQHPTRTPPPTLVPRDGPSGETALSCV